MHDGRGLQKMHDRTGSKYSGGEELRNQSEMEQDDIDATIEVEYWCLELGSDFMLTEKHLYAWTTCEESAKIARTARTELLELSREEWIQVFNVKWEVGFRTNVPVISLQKWVTELCVQVRLGE